MGGDGVAFSDPRRLGCSIHDTGFWTGAAFLSDVAEIDQGNGVFAYDGKICQRTVRIPKNSDDSEVWRRLKDQKVDISGAVIWLG
jgi:hypothetical protein